jgi:hypothetical protein
LDLFAFESGNVPRSEIILLRNARADFASDSSTELPTATFQRGAMFVSVQAKGEHQQIG